MGPKLKKWKHSGIKAQDLRSTKLLNIGGSYNAILEYGAIGDRVLSSS